MIAEASDQMWLVVKVLKTRNGKGYKLTEGNLIRLDRLRVQNISFAPRNFAEKPALKLFYNSEVDKLLNSNVKDMRSNIINEDKEASCRICLLETNAVSNPFISLESVKG